MAAHYIGNYDNYRMKLTEIIEKELVLGATRKQRKPFGTIIEITDFNAPELDVYARLTEAQLMNRFDPANAMFIAESPKVIERALDAGYVPISILVERSRMVGESLAVINRCKDIPIYTADMDVLTQLTGYRLTRGLLCAMRRKTLPPLES